MLFWGILYHDSAVCLLVLSFMQVPVTLLLSYLILDDEMKSVQYIFCALIIIGLLCVVWSNYTEEKSSERAKYVALPGTVQASPNSPNSGKICTD